MVVEQEQQVPLTKKRLGLFEKCQLAYCYEQLECEKITKAALCRRMGIQWNHYYHARRIITMLEGDNKQRYYNQGYGDKLDKLNRSLHNIDNNNRVKYASKKIKKWDNEIKGIERIPKHVKYLLSQGYSNCFIEQTILKWIISRRQAEPILGLCLCCHLKVCECEPNSYIDNCGSGIMSGWYRQLVDKMIDDWMERDEFCICGHHEQWHFIPWITDGGITMPLVCRDCNCYLDLKNERACEED